MTSSHHFTRALAAAVGLSAVLWLAACGGSSATSKQASSSYVTAKRSARTQASVATSSITTSRSSLASRSTQTAQAHRHTSRTATKTTAPNSAAERHAAVVTLADRATITVLSRCLESKGINVPPQSLSGPNPVFNHKGLDLSTPQFKLCAAEASRVYRAQIGGAGSTEG